MKASKAGFTVILAVLLSSLILSGCKGHNSRGAFALDYIAEVLDLTDSQEAELGQIREDILVEMKNQHRENNPIRDIVRKQLVSDKMNKDELLQVVAMHREQTDEVIDLAIDRLIDFHASLSIEQKEKLVSKLDKLAKKHRSHFN